MIPGPRDTIAAVATAPGRGGVGIVRISGPGAPEVGEAVFRRRGGRRLADAGAATLVLGRVADPRSGEVLDVALAARMPPGRSFTGEETVELHCHGGPAVLEAVLEAVIAAGARRAGPGEFTRRAHATGRMDLSQAEAVAELVEARVAGERRAALARLSGATGDAVRAIRGELLELAAVVEALIEFGEEEGLEGSADAGSIAAVAGKVERLVAAGVRLERASRGARVVIAGRANCGKSSLFNVLASRERAIVTAVPGTTRDFIEERVMLAGADVLLVDTAGIREPGDEAEAIGISRSLESVRAADAVLHLVDGSCPVADEDFALAAGVPGRRILVITKCDLPRRVGDGELAALARGAPRFETSAVTGAGCRELGLGLAELALAAGEQAEGQGPAPNARQTEALARAGRHLAEAVRIAGDPSGLDRLAEELRGALRAAGEVTGEQVSDEVIERIFSRFCVGK